MADNNPSDKRPLASKLPLYLKERIRTPGEKTPTTLMGDEGQLIYVGSVESVRSDDMSMNVNLYQRKGYLLNIPISFPYVGSMGIIGAMPEVGTNVILIKVSVHDPRYPNFQYYPIAYLPPGIAMSPDYVAIQRFPDSVRTDDKNVFFSKFRELRKGDVIVGSGAGSEIFLDKDIEIHNESGGTLLLRSGDQSIISTTLNNFMFSDGIWRSAGLIQRNSLQTKDRNGEPIFGLNAEEAMMEDGRKVVYIKPASTDLSYGNRIYSEYRLEVDEFGSRVPQSNDVNAVINSSLRSPVCVLSMGNFVGNSKRDPRTYGHLLGVRFFDTYKSDKGSFQLTPLLTTGGVDAPSILGMAYALHLPKNNAFIGIDKEGHYYQFFPASTSINPLGAGRSISVLAHGNKKEIYGSAQDGNSWDLTLKGGLKWRVGQHTDTNSNLSIDIRTTGPAYFEYGVPDEAALEDIQSKEPKKLDSLSAYGKIERVVGNSRYDIEGSREVRIDGSDFTRINGLMTHDFTSIKEIIGSVKTVSVGDSYSVTVLKEMNGKFGNRVTTIMSGSDELTVLKGNISRKITTMGDFETSTKIGDIKETILGKGNRIFSSTAGDYKVNCTAGNVEVMTKAGKVTIETKSGTVKISGPLGVDIVSTSKIKVNGSTVDLGSGALKGGVITTLSHRDYTTGAPLLGSGTVKAA